LSFSSNLFKNGNFKIIRQERGEKFMKKALAGVLLAGGVILGTVALAGPNVQATSVLTGKTAVAAKTIAGDVTLEVGANLDFEDQPLSEAIDFGTKELELTVTDYSGDANGYTIQAQVDGADDKRVLKIDGKEVNSIVPTPPAADGTTPTTPDPAATPSSPVEVHVEKTDTFGKNAPVKLPIALTYAGVTEKQGLTFGIAWTLVKGTTVQP
jgi:hypothetical protein